MAEDFGFKYEIYTAAQLRIAIRQHNSFYRARKTISPHFMREFMQGLRDSEDYLRLKCSDLAPDLEEDIHRVDVD